MFKVLTQFAIFRFLMLSWTHRSLLRAMAVHELRQAYVGTVGSGFWMIGLPLAMVFTYWFVFSVGFKVQSPTGEPFVLFFVCGLAPWLMFNEIVTTSVSVVTGNPHLVKKVAFPTEILPLVRLLTGIVTHLALLAIIALLLILYGRPWNWHALQLVYYLGAALVLALGLGWMLAAINVFFRDVAQIVTVIMGLWFWMTPIVWPLNMLPERYGVWLKFNPMYYITQGYRDSLLYHIGIWERPRVALYYWIICAVCLAVGAFVFRRFKPEFAETI